MLSNTSIFNQSSLIPKPIVSLYGICESYSIYNTMHYLSNGLILSIGRYDCYGNKNQDKKGHTEFLLFDPKNNIKTAEVILPAEYVVVSDVFDNKLLLRSKTNSERSNIVIFDCLELTILDIIPVKFDEYAHWTSIGNEKFVTIGHPDINCENAPFRLLIQDLKEKKFDQPASEPLPIDEKAAIFLGSRYYITVADFSLLPNGQYACMVLGHNSSYFKIFLFDRTQENQFIFAGMLEPKCYRRSGSSSTSPGNYVALPNGNILTYNCYGDHFQIWENTKCIDTWSWSTIKCRDKKFLEGFWTQQVMPLADSENLIIRSHRQLFMFNIKTRHMQTLNIGNFDPYDMKNGGNNNIIVRGEENINLYQVNNKILWVNLNPILSVERGVENIQTVKNVMGKN